MTWRLGIVIGLAAACLTAACTSTEPTETAAATAEGAEDVICRQILVPGSNVERRVCDTEEGWRDYDRRRRNQSQDTMRRMQGFGGAS